MKNKGGMMFAASSQVLFFCINNNIKVKTKICG